jgi:hypothetical protein
MIDYEVGCQDCGTLTREHTMPCRVALRKMIEQYGDLMNQAGSLSGTLRGNYAGERRKEAEAILAEAMECINQLFDD